MNILAIDPGTRLGWASDASGRLEWGEHDFSLQRGESPGMRFHNFNRWLRLMTANGIQPDVGLIVYEMPHLRGGAATDVLVGFTSRIVELCAIRKVEHVAVHSATLKKFALGSGRGDKEQMVAAAKLRLITAQPITDNMADALWLYWWAKGRYA